MKKEYDFSNGIRGKFFHSNAKLNIPVYLDEDVAESIQKYARKKKTDAQTIVNEMLRGNLEIIKAIQ